MIVAIAQKSEGIARGARAAWTGDGTAVTIALGFVPTWVELVNITDVVKFEKIGGMAANACLKLTAVPAFTVDATSAILINSDGTLTINAATNITAKAFVLIAG